MKFFVPYAEGGEAEQVWAGVRLHLSDLGLPTTRRRIHALSVHHEELNHLLTVGMNAPYNDEPVLIVLEASNVDVFYVCTPSRGVLKGEP